ncbi:Flp family type IVb pilin [Caballeronia sp. dw_276]|jgi:pilus assembly protein Flp/PilA|uniref:Flp family type IVb pilin n=1 Tax=Caballeronia sp. dw_276 TaxID=2719795 RepID=UPI001BD64497|nr:Flp family type IVb pilin [Caballeronia sp. dw_276]
MSNFIKRFLRDERGVTAIEYSLIAGIIVVALATALTPIATNLKAVFQSIASSIHI